MTVRHLYSALLVFLAAVADAAAQALPEAEPRPGQMGKDVMWVATADPLVERMLDLAAVTGRDHVIDLGSGDGVLVIAAARRGARAHGIEYDRGLYELSRRRAAQAGVAARASFAHADIFQSDLSAASVITMYLTDDVNLRLRPRLLALKPGTRIVSNTFRLGDWRPDDSVSAFSLRALLAKFLGGSEDHCFVLCSAYFWIVPAKVEGRWRFAGGELHLRQSFQMVSGALTAGARALPVVDGRLRGDVLSFRAGDTAYQGRVGTGRIEGIAVRDGVESSWSASLSGGAPVVLLTGP